MNTCKWCGKEFYSRNETSENCGSEECNKKSFDAYLKEHNYKITLDQIPDKYTSWGSWECNYDLEGLYNFFFSGQQEKYGMTVETQPPFQRDLVWTKKQKISWLEHVLKGGKTAIVFYCNCPTWNSYKKTGDEKFDKTLQLIDGQQRLSAVKDFVEGKIKVFGKYYFKDIYLRSFNNLRINVNDLGSREEVLKLYIEMNEGGTQHTKKEIDKVKVMLSELQKEKGE